MIALSGVSSAYQSDWVAGGTGTDRLDLDFANDSGYFSLKTYASESDTTPTVLTNAGGAIGAIQTALSTAVRFAYDGLQNEVEWRDIETVNFTAGSGGDLVVYQDGTSYLGGGGTDTFYADWSATTQAILWDNAPTAAAITLANGVTVGGFERLLLTTGSGNDIVKNTFGGLRPTTLMPDRATTRSTVAPETTSSTVASARTPQSFLARSPATPSPAGSTWTVTDTNLADGNEGTDTLTGIEFLKFSDGTRSLKTAASDFNGDGKSDILWRNASSGADAIWNGADNGSGVPVGGVADLNWKVAGVGDFNGDGKSDILWRNASSGADAIWNGANSGDSLAVGGVADLNWKVAGVGDFNGDGKSDILWRNASTGANGLWNGGNSGDSLPVGAVADLNWKVAGVGDFNGDGKDDILWRNTSTGYNAIWNGGDNSNGLPMGEVTDLNWKVEGVGDFNGDGKDDILWRNASTGYNAIWNGGDNSNGLPMGEVTDLAWKVAGTGDYNGDGKDDVLWRNASSGADAIWNGGDNSSSLPVGEVTDLNWQIPAQTNSWLTAAGDYPV